MYGGFENNCWMRLLAEEVTFPEKMNNLELILCAQCHGVIPSCQGRFSFHKTNHFQHICHYIICLCVVRRSGIIASGENEPLPLGVQQREEEEHLCALMLMMTAYMEKGASEGGKKKWGVWSCWQPLNVQLSHITLPSRSVSSLPSPLTGCGASCLHPPHWNWSGKQQCHHVGAYVTSQTPISLPESWVRTRSSRGETSLKVADSTPERTLIRPSHHVFDSQDGKWISKQLVTNWLI